MVFENSNKTFSWGFETFIVLKTQLQKHEKSPWSSSSLKTLAVQRTERKIAQEKTEWINNEVELLTRVTLELKALKGTPSSVCVCVCHTLQTPCRCPQGRCTDAVFWRRGRLCCKEWSPGFRCTATREMRSLEKKTHLFPQRGLCQLSMTKTHWNTWQLKTSVTKRSFNGVDDAVDFAGFLHRRRTCCLNKQALNEAASQVSV